MSRKFFRYSLLLIMLLCVVSCSISGVGGITKQEDSDHAMDLATSHRSLPFNIPARPFPQEQNFPGCIKPDIPQVTMNENITYFYQFFTYYLLKQISFTNGAVDGSGTGYVLEADAQGIFEGWGTVKPISQSEAHGWTMIILTLMAGHDTQAKERFDGMYRVYVNFPCKDNPDLMSWVIPANGDFSMQRQPSATDGDMDAAYALIMAHNQWGGGPDGMNITYLEAAKKIINALKMNNVITGEGRFYPRLGIGDHNPKQNYDKFNATRPSDYMLDHLTLFYELTGDDIWIQVRDTITDHIIPTILSGGNVLVPDFMGNPENDPNGVITTFSGISDESEGKYDADYYFNSCRFPWRYAMGYSHDGILSAKTVVNTINTWLVTKEEHLMSGEFNPAQIKSSYRLNGDIFEAAGGVSNDDSFDAAFMAGLTVADSSYQPQLTMLWQDIKRFKKKYYPDTISLLCMLYASGNWWKPVINATDPKVLSMNKPVFASSELSGDFTAVNIGDGNMTNGWAPATTDPAKYIYIDLEQQYTITKIVIHWYDPFYASEYYLGVTDINDKEWIAAKCTGDGGEDVYDLSHLAIKSRKAGIQIKKGGKAPYFGIKEIEIWGY